MRVLAVGSMYPPHHLGGYELTWRSAMAHLRALGHEVRILTTEFRTADPDPTIAEDPDAYRELRWYWREHDFPRLGIAARLRLERHNHARLRCHLSDWQPDVVNWWAMGGMSLTLIEAVRRAGVPAVGVVGDDWMTYGPKADQWTRACRGRPWAARPLARAAGLPATVELGPAAEWLFNSATTREHAQRAGWTLPKTRVVHPGIDSALFRATAENHEWKGRLLYVGRIDPRKGIETAIRALASLPAATLSVDGTGDDEHLMRLRELTRDQGLEGRVSFASPARHLLPTVYADADAVLFPVQWEEPWGLVPLEAMAVGTPVVATATGGSAEYLRDGGNCLVFRPRDDPGALATAVRRLAGDAALRSRIRAGGLETAARFSGDAFNQVIAEELAEAGGSVGHAGRVG